MENLKREKRDANTIIIGGRPPSLSPAEEETFSRHSSEPLSFRLFGYSRRHQGDVCVCAPNFLRK